MMFSCTPDKAQSEPLCFMLACAMQVLLLLHRVLLPAQRSMLQREAHMSTCRYFKSREEKGKAMDMFPPGRIVFVRPIKQVDASGHKQKSTKHWDAVWVQPTEIIAEGILVSPRVRQCLACSIC